MAPVAKLKKEITGTGNGGASSGNGGEAYNAPARKPGSYLRYPKLKRFMEIIRVHPEKNKNAKILCKFEGKFQPDGVVDENNEKTIVDGMYFVYEDKDIPRHFITAFVPKERQRHVEILTIEPTYKSAKNKARHQARKYHKLTEISWEMPNNPIKQGPIVKNSANWKD